MKFFGKRFFAIALLLCLSFSLFACSFKKQPVQQGYPQVTTEKEKTPEELLVGSWVPSSVKVIMLGKTYDYDANDFESVGITTFYNDGTVTGLDSGSGETLGRGNWHLEGKKIITAEGDATLTYTLIKIDQNSLILRVYLQDIVDAAGISGMDYSQEDYMETTYSRQGG